MEETVFKNGDIVQLKSGGEKMTIENFHWDKHHEKYRDDKVDCVWFEGKKLIRDTLP